MMTDIVQQLKWWATEDTEWTCTGGHDLCHGGTSAGSECPYCDKSITTEGEMMLGAVSEIETLRAALKLFLDDDRFKVAVGGNPIAVEKMLAFARAAYDQGKVTICD